MKRTILGIFVQLAITGYARAQSAYPTCYSNLADSSIRLNICMDALVRTNRMIYKVSDFEERYNQLAVDTLAYRGFRNARFFKVRLFDRNELESALYASTLDKLQLQEYYSHPERSDQRVIDSIIHSTFAITSNTSNTELAALTSARNLSVRHDVLYYLVNLECCRIWCVERNGKLLVPDAWSIADFLDEMILDREAQIILIRQHNTAESKIQLSKELREHLFVEELGTAFLEALEK